MECVARLTPSRSESNVHTKDALFRSGQDRAACKLGVCRPPADRVGFVVGSLDEAIRVFGDGFGATLVRTGETDGAFVTEVTGARGADLRTAMVDLAG